MSGQPLPATPSGGRRRRDSTDEGRRIRQSKDCGLSGLSDEAHPLCPPRSGAESEFQGVDYQSFRLKYPADRTAAPTPRSSRALGSGTAVVRTLSIHSTTRVPGPDVPSPTKRA
jgi:hypothetical protein